MINHYRVLLVEGDLTTEDLCLVLAPADGAATVCAPRRSRGEPIAPLPRPSIRPPRPDGAVATRPAAPPPPRATHTARATGPAEWLNRLALARPATAGRAANRPAGSWSCSSRGLDAIAQYGAKTGLSRSSRAGLGTSLLIAVAEPASVAAAARSSADDLKLSGAPIPGRGIWTSVFGTAGPANRLSTRTG